MVKFVKIISDKGFTDPTTKRRSSSAYIAVNEKGEKGCLPNRSNPYMPIGGLGALKLVVEFLEFKAV